jgi:hypothetical protein
MNQWQKLVKIVESDKEKRKEIAKALGSKNISKGVNKIITHIRNKTLNIERLKIIVPFLNLDIDEVIEDYQVTKRIIKKEQKLLNKIAYLNNQIYHRDNFKPYIYIETSRTRPTSITFAALCDGDMKYIRSLPRLILDLSKFEQIKLIRNIILNHFDENDGKCILFGDITGYIYYPRFNSGIKFSVIGDVIENNIPDIPQPECGLYYKVRKISINLD